MNNYSYITLLSLYESIKPIVNACHDSFTEIREPPLSSNTILFTMEEEEKKRLSCQKIGCRYMMWYDENVHHLRKGIMIIDGGVPNVGTIIEHIFV